MVARTATSDSFSTRWSVVKDIGLSDLRTLFYKLNDEEGNLPVIKHFDKDALLLLYEYCMGESRTESLDCRKRALP